MSPEVIAYQPKEAARVLGLGMTSLYALISAGKLRAKKAGQRTLITAESLRGYLDSLPDADIRTGQNDARARGFQPRAVTNPAN
jgi:excisionase family DNA binding protein